MKKPKHNKLPSLVQLRVNGYTKLDEGTLEGFHYLGEAYDGDEVNYSFKVTNTSNVPILLDVFATGTSGAIVEPEKNIAEPGETIAIKLHLVIEQDPSPIRKRKYGSVFVKHSIKGIDLEQRLVIFNYAIDMLGEEFF